MQKGKHYDMEWQIRQCMHVGYLRPGKRRERERERDGSSRLARLAAGNVMIPFDAEFLPEASTHSTLWEGGTHSSSRSGHSACGEEESPRSQERGQK